MRLFILFLLVSYSASAELVSDTTVTYTIKGKILSSSTYHGGVDYDYSNIPQFPMPNYTLLLVKWTSDSLVPIIISELKTDKNGEFKINVAPGRYGFVYPTERDSLAKGQWLPKSTEKWSGHNITYTSWQSSTGKPIEVTQNPVSNLVLVYHNDTYCIDCQ